MNGWTGRAERNRYRRFNPGSPADYRPVDGCSVQRTRRAVRYGRGEHDRQRHRGRGSHQRSDGGRRDDRHCRLEHAGVVLGPADERISHALVSGLTGAALATAGPSAVLMKQVEQGSSSGCCSLPSSASVAGCC